MATIALSIDVNESALNHCLEEFYKDHIVGQN